MFSAVYETLTVTCLLSSAVQMANCSRRSDHWQRNCSHYHQYGNIFSSRRPCWCTNVGMAWLRLTYRHTAC